MFIELTRAHFQLSPCAVPQGKFIVRADIIVGVSQQRVPDMMVIEFFVRFHHVNHFASAQGHRAVRISWCRLTLAKKQLGMAITPRAETLAI